ncbi:MAG: tetratricopeptide repeat protein [Planctomycetota bacterium]
MSCPVPLFLALLVCLAPVHAAEAPAADEEGMLDQLVDMANKAAAEADELASEESPHDIVFLSNGQQIRGQVERLPQDGDDLVTISTSGGGQLTLRRSQVASIKPSLARRLGQIDRLDRGGLLELARYCLIDDRREAAWDCLKRAHDHQPLDLNHLRLLARLTDEFAGPAEALPLYRRAQEKGATDFATLDRLAELEAAYEEWQQRRQQALAEIDKLPAVEEGMEKNPNWEPEDPKWANAATLETVIDELGPRKNHLLEVRFEGGEQYKAAMVLRLEEALDLSNSARCTFFVHNPELDDLAFSLALKTGNTREYFESRPFRVKAVDRWMEVGFDLQAKDFKAASTDWSPSTGVDKLDAVHEIQIQIHNQQRSGQVLIDGIGFQGDQGI